MLFPLPKISLPVPVLLSPPMNSHSVRTIRCKTVFFQSLVDTRCRYLPHTHLLQQHPDFALENCPTSLSVDIVWVELIPLTFHSTIYEGMGPCPKSSQSEPCPVPGHVDWFRDRYVFEAWPEPFPCVAIVVGSEMDT